jgi:hypothetical protein
MKGSEVLHLDPNSAGQSFDLDFTGEEPKPSILHVQRSASMLHLEIWSKGGSYFQVPWEDWSLDEPTSDDDWEMLTLQAGTYDFDGDGTDEIIFAWWAPVDNLRLIVIKYFPCRQEDHFGRAGNWKVFKDFYGDHEASVEGSKIVFHYLRSLECSEHHWVKDRFIHL